MQIDCIIGYGTPIYEAQLNDYVTLASLRSFSSFVGADFDDIVHEMGHDPETVQEGDFTPVEFLTALDEKANGCRFGYFGTAMKCTSMSLL